MLVPAPSRSLIYDYLTPDLAAQLAHYGDLTPAAREALAATLRRTLESCAAYVPVRLMRAQLADPVPGRVSGAFWQGTLLFADMSGFTALSEKLSALGKQGAEEISAIINRLFDALVAEVQFHHGALIKFGGDALTAFFDSEALGPVHAAAATGAALAMQARMQDFAAVETRLGTFRLGLRVGVHSGQVFAAEVGDSSHIELVMTGHEVNRVAEAQEIAAPGEVVVSAQTAALLEGARLVPRAGGFHQILDLPETICWMPAPIPLAPAGPADLETLELLARQVSALRPYLVRGLPRRFLDTTSTELGEFRPVSVLFANFHDFSALLDLPGCTAEQAALVLNAYFRRAQALVHQYGGIINKVDMYTHGDKLMALFGAPVAHEDDPLRAVHCALALEYTLEEANEEIAAIVQSGGLAAGREPVHVPRLQQHIGINTGTVFAGRVGGRQRYEYTVMGPAVNLAARLMAAAQDGAILLSPATRAAVEHQIDVKNHHPLRLKGLSNPIVPGLASGIREGEQVSPRSLAVGLERPTLVGREEELARLKAAAAEALHGKGRVLALVGEAGIGKTRLSNEVIQSLVLASISHDASSAVPPFFICTGDCQSYEQSTPYAAIRAPLHQLLNFKVHRKDNQQLHENGGPTPIELLTQRVQLLAASFVRFTPLLGDVLGVVLPETSLTLALSPEQRHDRLQELIVALLLGMAAQQPLLLLLEDVQWIDASSLEVLHRLVRVVDQSSILLLLNYRPTPPIEAPWVDLEQTVHLELRELPPEKGIDLIAALLGSEPPPAIFPLLDRTQGNPFYIEELVRALVTSHSLERDASGQWHLTCPLDQAAIPSSIEGLIVSRLDRLPESRYELVQVASVIGRRFQRAVLQGVYDDAGSLDQGLRDLCSADIMVVDAQHEEAGYLFRHALLRDVAYEGILYARRRDLHQRVARCIEELPTDNREESFALLAHHYLLAECWEPAFRYHLLAGVQSQNRYANRDALLLFRRALDLVTHLGPLPDQSPMTLNVIELYERSGDIYALLGESDSAEAAYLKALELLSNWRMENGLWREEAGATISLPPPFAILNVRLHRLLASLHERRSDYETAFDWLNRGIAWSTEGTHEELVHCYLLGAIIYHRQGENDTALDWVRNGLSIAEHLGDLAEQSYALQQMGNLWADQGELELSIQAHEQARLLFEQTNDITRLSGVLNDLGVDYDDVGRWEDAIRCYEQSLEISENIGDALMIAHTSNNLAAALVGRGELQRAYALYQYSEEQYNRVGSSRGVALTSCNRGEVLLLQGQPQEALQLIEASIAMMEQINARDELPQVLCLAAEATLALGATDRATAYATESLQRASELGMTVEMAIVQRVLGQIALSSGDFERAQDYFEQSLGALEQMDNRYELARVLFWQARLACASGHPDRAASLLQQAAGIFTDLAARRDLELTYELATQYELPLHTGQVTVDT